MLFRRIKIITLCLILVACNSLMYSGVEESIILYDASKAEQFIQLLEEKDVDYRIEATGQVFYPVEQKEIVLEAFKQVTGKEVPPYEPEQ